MNRREVVKLAVIGVGAIGCGGGGGDDPTPDAIEGTGAEMCGTNLCVDLAHASNAALMNVNGTRTLTVPNDKLIVVRTSATEFAVLSRVCTHNGCSVGFSSATQRLNCPCHGSQFDLTGAVVRDPADRALRRYQNMFDATTQTLTIVLA